MRWVIADSTQPTSQAHRHRLTIHSARHAPSSVTSIPPTSATENRRPPAAASDPDPSLSSIPITMPPMGAGHEGADERDNDIHDPAKHTPLLHPCLVHPERQCRGEIRKPDRHRTTDARQRNRTGPLQKQDADHGNRAMNVMSFVQLLCSGRSGQADHDTTRAAAICVGSSLTLDPTYVKPSLTPRRACSGRATSRSARCCLARSRAPRRRRARPRCRCAPAGWPSTRRARASSLPPRR